MLLYDSLNLIISGVHQSHLGCWGHRSENVPVRCLTERQNCYPFCQGRTLTYPYKVRPNFSLRPGVSPGYAYGEIYIAYA